MSILIISVYSFFFGFRSYKFTKVFFTHVYWFVCLYSLPSVYFYETDISFFDIPISPSSVVILFLYWNGVWSGSFSFFSLPLREEKGGTFASLRGLVKGLCRDNYYRVTYLVGMKVVPGWEIDLKTWGEGERNSFCREVSNRGGRDTVIKEEETTWEK